MRMKREMFLIKLNALERLNEYKTFKKCLFGVDETILKVWRQKYKKQKNTLPNSGYLKSFS